MSAVEAPVLLGRICSSWRIISLSTPHLWSSLHIAEPPFRSKHPLLEEKLAQRLDTAKMWLARSGERALSISLQAVSRDNSFSINELIRVLLPFASRWQQVTFMTPFSALATMSHLTEADVPMLKSVSISETYQSDDTIQWNSLRFLHSPAISSFHIQGRYYTPLELPLLWNGLTDLSISCSLTSGMSLQIFFHCPQLRTCQLVLSSTINTSSRGLGESVVQLPFLHTLDLQCRSTISAAFRQLFSQLLFPQLRILKLSCTFMPDQDAQSYTWPASAPRLESLDFTISQLTSKTSLAEFLRSLRPSANSK
ncbi:hypothetical protein FB451DRAFT_372176 [Mycena latifolia]|nr:hypothetical protein FB451DRAFT_372176 [Mycena latifolia]